MAKNEPLTAEQLAAIKARADAATTGPWVDKLRDFEGVDGYGLESHPTVEANGKTVCIFYEREIDDDNDEADATFIASAREDIPALLAEVERLRKQLDGLKKIVAFNAGSMSHPQWEKKYKLQYGMEIFEKNGIDNVIKKFRKYYRELPF